jgi:hypothetical protein
MAKNKAQKEARVLVDLTVNGKLYRSGELLTADTDVIVLLGDQVDPHPDAVAYCKGLNNG